MQTIYELNPTNEILFNPSLEQNWADSAQVLALVREALLRLSPVQNKSKEIVLGSWNAEYLWQAKAKHYIDAYLEILNKHHVLALQEVSEAGLATIIEHCQYKYVVSQSNNRGQAIGFLIHPRFHISKIYEYDQLIDVYGISNLRPALRVDLIDKQSDITLSLVTVHLKSMIGGLGFTGKIRQEQLRQLMMALNNNNTPTIIAGDFNCLLDTSNDIEILLRNNYNMADEHNHTSTQSCGGRLDGLFYRGLQGSLRPRHYNIRNFWRQNLLGRSLSDHGLLTWKINE